MEEKTGQKKEQFQRIWAERDRPELVPGLEFFGILPQEWPKHKPEFGKQRWNLQSDDEKVNPQAPN